jgi:hypothetical protein
VRREEAAGLQPRPVLAAEAAITPPFLSTMASRGPKLVCRPLTGMPGPSSPMMKLGLCPPPAQQ